MMLKALYYPHIDIRSPLILKNALLLWDSLERIVPGPGWSPRRISSSIVNEAVDLVVKSRVPTEAERRDAHRALQGMWEQGTLVKLISKSPPRWRPAQYLIYSDKFLNETWRMLERGGLAQWASDARDYGVHPVVGFLMMSLLADACAGTQIQKITDRVDAYTWLSQHHALMLGSQLVTGLDASQVAPAYDRLVTLSLEVLDAREISLRKLVEFRKREMKRGGTNYSAMRRRYLKTLQAHLKRIGTEARTKSDVRELERQFKEDLRHDLRELKAELNAASLKTLLSKEVVVSAVIAGGILIDPIPALTALPNQFGLLGVIPLLRAAINLRGARRNAFQRHTSSWLYLAR